MSYSTAQRHYRIATTAYLTVTVLAGFVGSMLDSTTVWIGCAAAVSLGLAAHMLTWVRRDRSRDGVERHVGAEAAALAFFTLIPVLISYSLFEMWAGAPTPSVMLTAVVAGAVWMGWLAAVKRRVA